GKSGQFRWVKEDDSQGMTAWYVGRYQEVRSFHEQVRIRRVASAPGPLRDGIVIDMACGSSELRATVTLDADSPALRFDVECHWRETGKPGWGVPQLNFHLPTKGRPTSFLYDVPFGVVSRSALEMDVPANRFAVAVEPDAARSLMLWTDSKHGYRGTEEGLSVTLIRSSYDPDPYPEFGVHTFTMRVAVVDGRGVAECARLAECWSHPLLAIPGGVSPSAATLPPAHSFARLEAGSVLLSTVKMPEDGASTGSAPSLLVRVYEVEGQPQAVTLTFDRDVERAGWVDLNEHPWDGQSAEVTWNRNQVHATVPPRSLRTLCVVFRTA
ncbi:MAG: hypothetical protein K6T30_01590, partial [Alicyclobacillus sp.]|nr:hypothetical protein [Alicyclobacillus sp.]